MSVTPIHISRISFNQRLFSLQQAIRANSSALYQTQEQLGTNRKFQQPSDDPVGAQAATRLNRTIEHLGHVKSNLTQVNAVLTQAESSAQDAVDLLTQAHTIALSAVGDTMTPDERDAVSTVVRSLLDQIVGVANRSYQNVYLFGGQTDRTPFEFNLSGVQYNGDGNRRETMVGSDGKVESFTIPGIEFFGAVSSGVKGTTDLDPALTSDTLLTSLNGAGGRGVRLGRVIVDAAGDRRTIDLTGAATVGDLVDKLNAELPTGMQAVMTANGITLTGGGGRAVMVDDAPGGSTATDLGLRGQSNADTRIGGDLNPRLTELTPISALAGGAGLALGAAFTIRNGGVSATIDLSRATNVQDVLNAINHADIGAWARISADGRSLDVVSRVSGVELSIEEAGGNTATVLGIRSMQTGTTLASLNDGRGVRTVAGNDIRITTRSGANIDVDLDGAQTVQDVIDRLNAAGGGAIAAGLAATGNGIRIVDQTAGGGTLAASALNNSVALTDLGLDVAANGGELVGRDVNPQRVDSPFTSLIELRDALESDDRLGIQRATDRLERVLGNLQQQQGQMASVAKTMDDRANQVDTESNAAEVLLSDVRDADFTDLAIRFQQLQNALQANLVTAGRVMNLSLLDYLR